MISSTSMTSIYGTTLISLISLRVRRGGVMRAQRSAAPE
jgi:hypothetical protein